jgi:hypothetical protein
VGNKVEGVGLNCMKTKNEEERGTKKTKEMAKVLSFHNWSQFL